MPPFPERDSSILAILKKKKPGRVVDPNDASSAPAAKESTSGTHAQLTSTMAPVQQQNGQTDLLVDVLGDVYSNSQSQISGNKSISPGINAMLQNNFGSPAAPMEPVDSLKKLVWKNNGVLFESDLVQIGVKSEYRSNLGRMTLFYGNKTPLSMLVSLALFPLQILNYLLDVSHHHLHLIK